MSLLTDKILEDIDKMNQIDKNDFMEDYCEKYGCAEKERAEELIERESLLTFAVKMLIEKSMMEKLRDYIKMRADKCFVDDFLKELEVFCEEDYRFE